jgi:hypothetical protein
LNTNPLQYFNGIPLGNHQRRPDRLISIDLLCMRELQNSACSNQLASHSDLRVQVDITSTEWQSSPTKIAGDS